MPVDWDAAWKTLSRFPRPHLTMPPSAPDPPAGTAAPTVSEPHTYTEREVRVMNKVTAADNPKGERQRAVEVQTQLDALPKELTSVTAGTLYFIITPPSVNEGTLRVGLARVVRSVAATSSVSAPTVPVKWYIRSKWRTHQQQAWDRTPTFERAGDPSLPTRQLQTNEPLSAFLPVSVQVQRATLSLPYQFSPLLPCA